MAVSTLLLSLSLCSYKNGSQSRERVRDECAGGSWEVREWEREGESE